MVIVNGYKHIKNTFKAEFKNQDIVAKSKIAGWKDMPVVSKLEKPTNIARARELGYKAKQGVFVARVRVERGLSKRQKTKGGRKPSKSGRFFAYSNSLKSIAEGRAARRFNNCEVLNSYYIGEDAKYKFFEAIMLDRSHPSVLNDKVYSVVVSRKGRAFRGLTKAGRKHRN